MEPGIGAKSRAEPRAGQRSSIVHQSSSENGARNNNYRRVAKIETGAAIRSEEGEPEM